MYNQVSDIDPARLLAAAERESALALALSPQRQEIYFSMSKTKALRGDYVGARDILKTALDFDPKVVDAHFYYGLLLSANKDFKGGYEELKKAISLGKTWKNYYEPRVVANYFMDAGHMDEAVALYKEALRLNPDGAGEILIYPLSEGETRINSGIIFYSQAKNVSQRYLHEAIGFYDAVLSADPMNLIAQVEIGAAYFFLDNHEKAKEYLGAVVQRPEFIGSPLQESVRPILDKLGIRTATK
jgi:tetratricopeptide (TPR) repeat protein